jgi:hypothetical protein
MLLRPLPVVATAAKSFASCVLVGSCCRVLSSALGVSSAGRLAGIRFLMQAGLHFSCL